MQKKNIKPQKTSTYYLPTEIYFGRGSIKTLNKIIGLNGNKKFLLICGEHFKKSQDCKILLESLKKNNVDVYKGMVKNSDFSTINQIADFCRNNKYEGIIAIGGGKILDIGKSVSILTTHDGFVQDYVSLKIKKIKKKGLYYIAIPTTSGTGSEVTPWATIWGDDKRKYSLTSKNFMFPNIAIVDPALTDNLPGKFTAESGIDALCQAIEAYWNINHNPTSDKYALEAIEIIIRNIQDAVNNPNKEIRDNMAWGSLLGGLAFSNTQTTICHAISYPITAYWEISHGQATSITLPSFLKTIAPVLTGARQTKLLHALSSKDFREASLLIETIMAAIGLKTHLSQLGISKDKIDLILNESSYTNRIDNTPIKFTKEELKAILYKIY